MAHTPGPWRYSRDEFDDWGYIRAGKRLVAVARYDIDNPTDAQLDEHRRNRTDPCAANARVIAAAPDLLAALEELMGASLDDDEGIEAAKRLGSALQAARAAINKAEGR